MTIQIGDAMPAGNFSVMGTDGPEAVSSEELFSGKKVVLFSVPGAFTPSCTARHLPGYVDHADALRERGAETIACLAVNDVFVMSAWGRAGGADGKVAMLADGNGEYARALGLELDATGFGMGMRGQRFSMIVDDGVVTHLNIEPAAGDVGISSAEAALDQLG